MTDFFDPSFSLPLLVGVVAAVLAGYALWKQKQDRSISVTTLNLVKTSSVFQEKNRREIELELTKLRYVVQAALIVLGIAILAVVLIVLFSRPAVKGNDRLVQS